MFLLILLILVGLFLWILWGNTALTLTKYTVTSKKLPSGFTGFRIAHVSDLHNTKFGKHNEKLLDLLAQAQPDIIAITGDMIDSRQTDPDAAIAFAKEAVKIAPVCYVPGNHEARIQEYPDFRNALSDLGVTVLENSHLPLVREQESITVSGRMDPGFKIPTPDLTVDTYQILLSHRPELIEEYAKQGYDLVLSGHAHGGQIRLPFVGGVIAPHQGFFPKYTEGIHRLDNTTLVISRGLGNSLFPLRIHNRPELILITLESI